MSLLTCAPLLLLLLGRGALAATETTDLLAAASGGSSYGHSSYGYKHCDCSQYDLLGVLAGGAALSALLLFLLLQQAAAARSLAGWVPPLPPALAADPLLARPSAQLADDVVNATCQVVRLMEQGRLGAAAGIAGARSGYDKLGGFCDCFLGIIGALTGFAALAGFAAFAVQQAAAAAAAAARSLTSGAEGDGSLLVAAVLSAFVHDEDQCLPLRLCSIGQRARRIGPRTYAVLRLASLPASWFLSSSSSSPHGFSDFCDALTAGDDAGGTCDVRLSRCLRRSGAPADGLPWTASVD